VGIWQITDKGYSVADVSRRLYISIHSLYAWVKILSRCRSCCTCSGYSLRNLE